MRTLLRLFAASLLLITLASAASRTERRPRNREAAGDSEQPGLAEYLSKTEADIARIDAADARLPRKPIVLGCNLILAHGSTIARVPDDVLLAYADALKEAGAQRIEINPLVTARDEAQVEAKYTALVNHIRKLGLKVAINPEATEPSRGGITTFEQYQKEAISRYESWASRLQPDEFVLVHEPTTMSARMHIETRPEQWRAFIEATASVVRRASPRTRIGAGCFAGTSARETPFFEEFSRIPVLQFLTADNYVSDAAAIERMDHMAAVAHSAKKPIYIEETWRPHFILPGTRHEHGKSMESESALGFGYKGFEALDAKWLDAMARYAATHGFESMTAFQTRCFFLYVDAKPTDGPEFDSKVEQAIRHRDRTDTFRAFQRIANESR